MTYQNIVEDAHRLYRPDYLSVSIEFGNDMVETYQIALSMVKGDAMTHMSGIRADTSHLEDAIIEAMRRSHFDNGRIYEAERVTDPHTRFAEAVEDIAAANARAGTTLNVPTNTGN